METNLQPLNQNRCSKARLARDARFDGLFFVGVKTTGIFCRPVCPATPPKERNVQYFSTALGALQAGLRPCLRCRPEAAPGSPAWRGVQTTLSRAVRMIDNGEWRGQSLPEFAERLGVSDRYLRRLFTQQLGIAPLQYASFCRVLFAKQLLQQTSLPVAEVAHIAGFGSVRRFNSVFSQILKLNPRQLRNTHAASAPVDKGLTVFLSYRPPYAWPMVRDFYRARHIAGLENVTDHSYSRSFALGACTGVFSATHVSAKHGFQVELSLSEPTCTLSVIQRIRHLLDLDTDASVIASDLKKHPLLASLDCTGIRLPGLWSPFEAGVRAILGQQVSVKAARNLASQLVRQLGAPIDDGARRLEQGGRPDTLFPAPAAVAHSDLAFLAMPDKRRQALRALANWVTQRPPADAHLGNHHNPYEDWLAIPGIGPWTVQYTAFRTGHPDVFLAGDLGVKNALYKLAQATGDTYPLDAEAASPWGSYATLLLWRSLALPDHA